MLNGYIKKNGELVRINPNNYTLGTGRVVSFTSGQWVEDGGRYKLVLPKSVSGANAIYELQTDGAYAKVILDTELTETNTILYSEAGFDGYCILGGNIVLSVDSVGREISSQLDALSGGKIDKASPKNSDGKDLALADNVLALSGGTMTGAILTNDNVGIRRNGSTGFLQFGFQPVTNGVRINLFGKDYADDTTLANGFQIVNANGTVFLVGKNDGTLTWGGKEVERVSASGTRYIRYESGLQICWGAEDAKASTATQFYWDITVPVAYKDTTYSIVCTNQADITATATGSCQYSAGPKSTTVFRVIGTARWGYRWIAIGRWK